MHVSIRPHLQGGYLEEHQQPEMRRRAHRVPGSVENDEPRQGLETVHLRQQRCWGRRKRLLKVR